MPQLHRLQDPHPANKNTIHDASSCQHSEAATQTDTYYFSQDDMEQVLMEQEQLLMELDRLRLCVAKGDGSQGSDVAERLITATASSLTSATSVSMVGGRYAEEPTHGGALPPSSLRIVSGASTDHHSVIAHSKSVAGGGGGGGAKRGGRPSFF